MENGKWTVGRSFRVSPAVFQVLETRSTRTASADRPLTGRGKLGDPTRRPVWGQVPISPLCRRPGSRAWQSRGLPAATMPKVDGDRTHKGRSLHAARIEMMSSGDWIYAEYRRVLRGHPASAATLPAGHRGREAEAQTATSSAPLRRGHDLPARHNAPIVGSSRCFQADAIQSAQEEVV